MELLAPAGNYECLEIAIKNGCDAVYLGLNEFGARAYAKNFSIDDLRKAIKFAHLRNVKIYITMNTIIFDEEIQTACNLIDELAVIGVDGIIIQDITLINYIKTKYTKLEAHASTQTGIDSLNAVLFFNDLKTNRVVVAREMQLNEILEVKKSVNMEIEVFVHGALCVSYSGNCLMSGLIGYRSGNRGRCVGSCRKTFTLFDSKDNVYLKDLYLLSMKDLNAIDQIKDFKGIDSLKIEGRMKEATYVANVVKSYREVIDGTSTSKEANYNLSKTFNRTFTKGYLLNEDRKDVININRPNHHGYEIGKVIGKKNNRYTLKLSDTLNQNDQIRINEISIPIVKMYDNKGNYIKSSNDICYIDFSEKCDLNDIVYKTNDVKFNDELNKTINTEYRRFDIDMYVTLQIDKPIELSVSYKDIFITVNSDVNYEKALKSPVSIDSIKTSLSKLNDTIYNLDNIEIAYVEGFISLKSLNELRRKAIALLDEKRLEFTEVIKDVALLDVPKFNNDAPKLSVYASTQAQYDAAISMGIKEIYFDNIARRNKTSFPDKDKVLVGGYNGLNYYRNKAVITSDFSLNVCNHEAVAILHNYGVNKITLSYELNKKQINDLVVNYFNKYNTYPNLELIVYGRADLMFTNYCPLKQANLCGKCKKETFYLKDEFGTFPIITHNDCTTTILNGKFLNLIDNLNEINNVNYYRLQLTTESFDETIDIITKYQNKLNNDNTKYFNPQTDTRGHFKKEIM
ncbi:MAG: U32 family peptidase [bacterium]